MRKILILFILIFSSCKPTLVRNYKVVEYKIDKKRTYYTDTITQTTRLDSLVFNEYKRNGKVFKYKVAVNDVKVFEKND